MSAFEAELAHELRALPIAAPPALRERVRALGEPEPRRVPQLTWRRAVVVLAPACLVALLAAAAISGLRSSAPERRAASGGATVERAPTAGPAHRAVTTQNQPFSAAKPRPAVLNDAPVPAPSPTRHQDYEADLQVRVNDLDALGRRTADAMRITRSVGGYVASVSQSTSAGRPGEADLVLRIPVQRVEDTLIRLSALGTVLEQHVSIVDLENTVQQQRQRIRALKLQIVRLTAALRQELPADVRLRLQFLLDDARRNLANATGQNKATLREAALSRVSLSLTTQRAALVTTHHHSRLHNAVGGAVDFLAAAGAIALAALIVLAPLLLIAALAWYGVRTWRRREERRLLAEA
jgi:hypothetical protein